MLIPLWVVLIVMLTAVAYSVTWDLLVAEVDGGEAGLEGRDEGGGTTRIAAADVIDRPG
ncbi:MAG: hypothetical protein J2P17_26025 [Mycobacterium sp.]|nr:hypothetical protein [Mycobacterium sp.]